MRQLQRRAQRLDGISLPGRLGGALALALALMACAAAPRASAFGPALAPALARPGGQAAAHPLRTRAATTPKSLLGLRPAPNAWLRPTAMRARVLGACMSADEVLRDTVLIVGGGPGGLLAATLLAEQGVRVKVHEQLPHPADKPLVSPRSYQIAVKEEGRKALLRVGDVEDGGGIFKDCLNTWASEMRGWMTWKADGSPPNRTKQFDDEHVRLALPREAITRSILAGIEASSLPIEVKFNTRLSSLALNEDGTVTAEFEGAGGVTESVRVPLVLGCDGRGSLVRGALEEGGHWGKVEHNIERRSGRTGLWIPFGQGAAKRWDEDHYQVFESKVFMTHLIGSPWKADRTWRCTFVMGDDIEEKVPLIRTKDPNDAPELRKQLLGLWGEHHADVFAEDVLRDMIERSSPTMERHLLEGEGDKGQEKASFLWVKCEAYASTKGAPVALIGDAAHGMLPSQGLGCNMAFQGAALLADLAAEAGPGWLSSAESVGAVLKKYSDTHVPIAHGAQIESKKAVEDNEEEGKEGEEKKPVGVFSRRAARA